MTKTKRALLGLPLAIVLLLGACATKPPSYNVATPDADTQKRMEMDPKLKEFVTKMEGKVYIVTSTSPAQDVNDVTLKTQSIAPQDFKGPEDFKPLGAAQADSFNGKLATTAVGAAIGAVGVVGGAVALGKTMPAGATATSKACQGQSQATSGVAGNVTASPC